MKAISPNIPARMYIHWKYTKEAVRNAVWDPCVPQDNHDWTFYAVSCQGGYTHSLSMNQPIVVVVLVCKTQHGC